MGFCCQPEQILVKLQYLFQEPNGEDKSSHQRCSVKKGVLKNFANFTGKHLCWSLFLKKFIPSQVFSCDTCEMFKNAYFEEHLLTTAFEVRIFKKRMSTKLSWIIYLESKTAIHTEAYPELSKSSRMEIFGKIVNGWMICLHILEKYSTENFFCAVKFLRK